MKKGMKDALAPQGLFEDLGPEVRRPGRRPRPRRRSSRRWPRPSASAARSSCTPSPRRASATTPPSATRPTSSTQLGPVRRRDRRGGRPKGRIWTDVFADEMVAIGAERPDVVAITAAMLHPVGLDRFAARFPDRIFDVGIAEQHAATSRRGPGHRRAAPGRRGLRDLPQPGLRPGADGRRAAPLRRHLRRSTGPA